MQLGVAVSLGFPKSKPRSDQFQLIANFDKQEEKVDTPFKFEVCWLLMPDIRKVLDKAWNETI